VFIPILFLGGIIGRLFHEFAVTIAVSILVSGVVSLSLTPMLASRFLHPESETKHGRLYMASERAWLWVIGRYEHTLAMVMRHRPATMVFSLGILIATGVLYAIIPKGFMPSEDTGRINATTEAAQGISFEDMARHQKEIADVVAKDTNVAGFMSSIGASGSTASFNQGRLFMGMKPRNKRISADQFIAEIRPKLARVPGMTSFLTNPPTIQIGGRVSKGLYQYTLQSTDIATLYLTAQQLLDSLKKTRTLQDVSSDLLLGNPQASIQINRERAASLGVTAAQIENALYDAYGSGQVSTIFTPNNEYWVEMELEPRYQRDLSALSLLYIHSNTGTLVPLSAVAAITQSNGALTVNHSGQLPSVTITYNLPPGVALGGATADIQRIARNIPSTITAAASGTAQAFQSAQAGLVALLILAIFVIYVVLGILYESFIHPITILSGLPFAAFGALLTLLIFRVDLSVYAFVGIILLVGLVKKNAIMMIDFAVEAERSEHLSPEEAILKACLVRFRPIMMTTMAALLGTLPIAMATGSGSESRRPLGIAVVGGLFFSQIITLYITPVVYTYMDRVNARLSRWMPRGRRSRPEPVPAD
jgi:HAE1 family hydrophobic/amphiphilic exporter-1